MRRIVVIVALLAVGALAWLYGQQGRTARFVVSGYIEADVIRVGSRVGGRVAEVSTAEGSLVKPGDTLYRLDPFDLNEQLAQARASLAAVEAGHARLSAGFRSEEIEQARAHRDQAAATLERLVAGPRQQEITVAREQVNLERASLDLAESEHERLKRLVENNQGAQRELDEAIRAVKAARARVAAAEQQLALLEEGTRKEDIAAGRAALAEAEQALKLSEQGFRKEDIAKAAAEVTAARARVSAIETQMRELVVTSPCKCVVEAIELQPGDLVGANAPSVSLLDISKLWVRSYVPEARLGEIQLGQEVPIEVDSLPGQRLRGRVSFIAREAEFTPKNIQTPEERSKQVFRIKVTLEEGLDRARVGMAADLRFDEAKK
ncbi:MAG TPA: efflux RND transporter periplasmic adaptor subunit [Phycisphaerae bacterium]|nr:efflux RND transporter periplasmic adaptor subunit [Phycisphaerae bacterium]